MKIDGVFALFRCIVVLCALSIGGTAGAQNVAFCGSCSGEAQFKSFAEGLTYS